MDIAHAALRLLNATADTFIECNNKSGVVPIERNTTWQDLWHPYILLYTGHCINLLIWALASLYVPKTTAVVMTLSGLTFLISAAADIPIWGYHRDEFEWWGVFTKWLIVNLAAGVPVLLMRGVKFSDRTVRMLGIPIYVILGSNVVWTMFAESHQHVIVYINKFAGVMLTISLILHCAAVCRAGYGLFEVKGGMPYGFGTSYAWILCYTIWNVYFAARIGLGTTLQDILFWVLMSLYKYLDDKHLSIELYFGFARPVQLGSYIAYTEFVGAFVPYFYNAPTLTDEQPVAIYQNAYFLFICAMNAIFSVFVVYWSLHRLIYGLGFFQERFEMVHKIDTGSDDEAQEMEALTGSDAEEESDDEGGSGCVVS